ncbi:hypothetical protein Hanom_Chr11g00987281 [Helianthus anomalus]
MELTSRMKMTRFQTFWIQMRKNKPLNESHKSSQNSATKMTFYSKILDTIMKTSNQDFTCKRGENYTCQKQKKTIPLTHKNLASGLCGANSLANT